MSYVSFFFSAARFILSFVTFESLEGRLGLVHPCHSLTHCAS
jgi:hypothetical protein